MNWLDIVILLILIGVVGHSAWRGLVRSVISFGSVILAAILATRYCQAAAEHLSGIVRDGRVASLLGFILIFLSIIAAGILIGRLTRSFLKKTGLGPMDRFLGGVLGILKSAVIIAVIIMLVDNFAPNGHKIIAEGEIAPICRPLGEVLADFLPQSLLDKLLKDIERGVDKFKQYQEKFEKEGSKLEKKYKPDINKLIPDAVKEELKRREEALEEDKKTLRNIVKEHLTD